jgi:hypothetical protein
MTNGLRKGHFFLWPLISILLLGGWYFSVQAIPTEDDTGVLVQSELPAPLPNTLLSSENESPAFNAVIRNDTSGILQVEIELKEQLTNPAVLVYAFHEEKFDRDSAHLIGQLNNRQINRFSLDSTSNLWKTTYGALYDPIQKRQLATFIINP